MGTPQARYLAPLARQLPVATALAVVAGLAWLYLIHLARRMPGMGDVGGSATAMDMAMPQIHSWSVVEVALAFVMWAVMMVAMMLPAAAPMILLYARLDRGRSGGACTTVFVAGYVVVWTAFSAVAALVQWGLHEAALLSPMADSTSPLLGGSLLLAAGLYQWTPFKHACLRRCRSPLSFLMSEWRDGARGALRMGISHGAYCVGCCWLLMGLLFVAGVMNLLWVVAIAAFVLLEKIGPAGGAVARAAGVLLAVAGIAMLSTAWR